MSVWLWAPDCMSPAPGFCWLICCAAPNVRLYVVMTFTNLIKEPRMEPFYTVYDNRPTKWAEGYILHDDFQEDPRNVSDTFVVGALQIDKFGNSNLIGVGKDYKHLDFRGPGAVGTLTMAHYVDRYYLFVQSHNKKIFVDKCDFISTVGWGQGGADGRKKLGIPGSGPVYCITPLCVFDFDENSKRMRLKSLHPGVTHRAGSGEHGLRSDRPRSRAGDGRSDPGRNSDIARAYRYRRHVAEVTRERIETARAHHVCQRPVAIEEPRRDAANGHGLRA